MQTPLLDGAHAGVALAVNARCRVLATHTAAHVAAAALHITGVGPVVVAGVYIPPITSKFAAALGGFSDLLDEVGEAVATLQLRCNVPREAVYMVGDYNAHLGHTVGGCPLPSMTASGFALRQG